MVRIFSPISAPEDWKPLLAEPEKQWKSRHSAKTLAYCWQEADGFPNCVKGVFAKAKMGLFHDIELLLAFPEYQVFLPPYRAHPSQNDLFVLAKGNNQLVSVMVEGKVSEPFGETIAEWTRGFTAGKQERLAFLRCKLALEGRQIDHVRYQLLHRTASAIIEAEKFNALNALVLVHSFSETDEWFGDYRQFVALFDLQGKLDSLVGPKKVGGVDLYFAWVKGDHKYLEM